MHKHQSKSEHAHKLMGNSHHTNSTSPAHILMREHRSSGGSSGSGFAGQFKKGGRVRHAEGGPTDLDNTMHMQPNNGQPATAMKKGGRSRKCGGGREHHFWGALAGQALPYIAQAAAPYVVEGGKKLYNWATGKAHGGSAKPLKRAMGGAGKVRKGMMTETGKIR
jgi:hypothetical protein